MTAFEEAIQANVEQFRNKLVREVGKITCDLDGVTDAYVKALNREGLEQLVGILKTELEQVIAAVKEAK